MFPASVTVLDYGAAVGAASSESTGQRAQRRRQANHLHRRHDRAAEGCAVAARGLLLRCAGRRQPLRPAAAERGRDHHGGRRGAGGRLRHHRSDDARRRDLHAVLRVSARRDGRAVPQVRRRDGAAAGQGRARDGAAGGRRRDGPADRRRAGRPARRVRPVLAAGPRLRRRAAVGAGARAAARPAAERVHHRPVRRLGDRLRRRAQRGPWQPAAAGARRERARSRRVAAAGATRRDRAAGQVGPRAAGLLRRRGRDPGHVPGPGRGQVRAARRPGEGRGRRVDRGPRPGLHVHQYRRREGVPRGGRAGAQGAPRGAGRGRGRGAGRALRRAGRRRGRAAARHVRDRGGTARALPGDDRRVQGARPDRVRAVVVRSPSGKADYRWARAVLANATE